MKQAVAPRPLCGIDVDVLQNFWLTNVFEARRDGQFAATSKNAPCRKKSDSDVRSFMSVNFVVCFGRDVDLAGKRVSVEFNSPVRVIDIQVGSGSS